MSPRASSPLRALRCAVLAGVVLALSGAAHAAAGGALPGAGPAAALGVVVACACAVVTRWRLSPMALLGVLGASQVLLHQVLEALAAPRCAPVDGLGHHAGAIGPAVLAAGPCPVPTAALHHGAGVSTDLGMLASHAAATVVLAALLAHGERLAWELWAWLAPLRVLVGAVHLPPPHRSPITATPQLLPRPCVVPPTAPRRGPPVRRCAVVPALG